MAQPSVCPACGAGLPEGALFCATCGNATPTQLSGETGATVHPADAAELGALSAELREALAPGLMLVRPLGQGGMGTVFLARDPALKRNVVVKVLSPALAVDEHARRRFEREAEAAAAVAHPHVVSVFQVGELPRSGTSYFVMQYVEGHTLEAACPPGTPVPAARARRIVGEIASALAAAHSRGVVHRDIKPANVMLEAESDRVIVLDFGISAAVSPERQAQSGTKLTQQGVSVGTPQYMSPEQAAGESVTDRSDVYSLGLIAFELLTGRAVFEERTPMALLAAHIHREAPKIGTLLPDLEPAVADLVDGCLAKTAAQRPAAADIARMLVPSVQPRIEWPPPGLERVHGRGWLVTRRAVWTAAAAAAVFVLLYVQPVIATGAWTRGETSWFWRTLWAPQRWVDGVFVRPVLCSVWNASGNPCPPPTVDALALWIFGVTAFVTLAGIGAAAVLLGASRLEQVLRSGRRAGYPWPVLLSVAWDAGPDTVDLLNAQGPYVLVGDAKQRELLRRRRSAQGWVVGGAALTALMPLLWWLGALVVGDAGARWLTGGELLLVAAPLAVGLAWRAVLLTPERRLLRPARRSARRGAARVTVAPALVEGWLQACVEAVPSRSRSGPVARLGFPILVVAVVLIGVVPVLLGVHGFATWYGPSMRGEADVWLRYQLDLGGGDNWRELDRGLAGQLSRIPMARRDPGRVVLAAGAADSMRRRRVVQEFEEFLGPYFIAELRRDTGWPWLPQWRSTVAAVAALEDSGADRSLQAPGVSRFRALAAAGLAMEAGDVIAARERVREALVVCRYLLRTRSLSTNLGLGEALNAYRLVSQSLGDSLATKAARDLLGRYRRWAYAHLAFYPLTPYTLMSDPDAPPGERFVSSPKESPGIRRWLALGAVGGLCLNGREMLFGISSRRRALIDRVAAAAPDVPSIGREVRTLEAAYDRQVGSRHWIFEVPARVRWCSDAHIFSR